MRNVVLALLVMAGTAAATSYAPPTRHDVWSSDRAFVLDVDPGTGTLTIFPAGDRHAPRWSFQRAIDFNSFWLAADGQTVAVVAWTFVSVDDLDKPAVEIWRAAGRVKAYSVRELIAHPPHERGVGPIGRQWREWLDHVAVDGDVLTVATAGPWTYTFDLATDGVDRHLAAAHAATWVLGIAMLGVAIVLAWSSRHRWAALAPILGALALWLELTGIPFAPASPVDLIGTAVWVLSLLAIPISIVRSWRLGGRTRSLHLAAIAAINIAPIALAIATC